MDWSKVSKEERMVETKSEGQGGQMRQGSVGLVKTLAYVLDVSHGGF